jgi:hypothetical protein
MATKKNRTTRSPSRRTTKGRRGKAADGHAGPAAAEAQTEPASAEAAENPIIPSPELASALTPAPAEAEATAPLEALPDLNTQAKKLSALDAAVRVLGESGRAMSCPELIVAMAAQGYWSSPKGRTPASTLYSAVLRELQTKGEQARFLKTQRGRFALKSVP